MPECWVWWPKCCHVLSTWFISSINAKKRAEIARRSSMTDHPSPQRTMLSTLKKTPSIEWRVSSVIWNGPKEIERNSQLPQNYTKYVEYTHTCHSTTIKLKPTWINNHQYKVLKVKPANPNFARNCAPLPLHLTA